MNLRKKNSLGVNAFLNGLKTGCSILFPFISFVYCSRILGKENLGKYSFGQSIIAYLLLVAALGIPNYSIREGAGLRDNKQKLSEFINQVFTINCITTCVSYAALVLILFIPKFRDYRVVILIQSIQILLTTLGADWINTVFEDYLYLAVRYIAIQILSLLALFIFVRDSHDLYSYTLISMLSNAGGNIFNWFYLRKQGIVLKITHKVDFKRHLPPILILFGNSVASVIYLNSDITILGILTNDATVGVYSVSTKIYTMTKTMINAIIMVTLPRFSYYLANKDVKRYRKELERLLDILTMLVLPVIIGMFLEADRIIVLTAGSEYISGTAVVRIYSFAILFAIGACLFSYAVLIPNKLEKYFLMSTMVAAIVNISLNFVLIPIIGMNAAAITTLIAEVLVFLISLFYSMRQIKFSINKMNLGKYLTAGLVMVGLLKLMDRLSIPSNLLLLLEIGGSVLVYFGVLAMLRCDNVLSIIDKLYRKK